MVLSLSLRAGVSQLALLRGFSSVVTARHRAVEEGRIGNWTKKGSIRNGLECDKQTWRPTRCQLGRLAQELRGSLPSNPKSLPELWPEDLQARQ